MGYLSDRHRLSEGDGQHMPRVGPWEKGWVSIGQIDDKAGDDPVRIRLISYEPMQGIIDVHVPSELWAAVSTNQRRVECTFRRTDLHTQGEKKTGE